MSESQMKRMKGYHGLSNAQIKIHGIGVIHKIRDSDEDGWCGRHINAASTQLIK
jgi:hypothetical protein